MSEGRGREEPKAVPLDLEGQQRELEGAGWKPLQRQGKLLWKHPESGHLYPQGMAIARLREEGTTDRAGEPRGARSADVSAAGGEEGE